MTTAPDLRLPDAARELSRLAAGGRRTIVGITGPPGAGKSTAGEALTEACRTAGTPTVLVPMDGFHLAQAVLDHRKWAEAKGAPHTFDAAGYVELIARIRREGARSVWAPAFDRELEDPVAGAIEVRPEHRLVLTEGNYLLLPDEPWTVLPALLDRIWYVDTPQHVRQERLIERHRRHGRATREAAARTLGPDEDNARLVRASRPRADAVLSLD